MARPSYAYTKWRRQRREIFAELGINVGKHKGFGDMIRTEVVDGHIRFERPAHSYPCEHCNCHLVPLPSKCLGNWHYSMFCPMCDLGWVADAFAKMEAYVVEKLGPCPPKTGPTLAKAQPKVAA